MTKNIVLLADGTWNEGEKSNTNIHWLNANLVRSDSQVVFYEKGVGTDWFNERTGGALGVGLSRGIRSLYADLVSVYEPGDSVYCFGFSRGAYTVRSLCGFISLVGNIGTTDKDEIEEAYDYYQIHEPDEEDNWFERLSKPKTEGYIPIRLIGVFDTVGSLGVPFEIEDDQSDSIKSKIKNWFDRLGDRLRRPITGFHNTALGSNIEEAYHALALDERRVMFPPTLWTEAPGKAFRQNSDKTRVEVNQTMEQRWFRGVHSDVGGGYPVADDEKLAHVPLNWIVGKAQAAGLVFDQQTTDQLAQRVLNNTRDLFPHHDSMTSKWVKFQDTLKKESIVRPAGNNARQAKPTGTSADHLVQGAESIDASVQASIGKAVTVISEASPTGVSQAYSPQNFDASMVDSTAPT